MEKAIKLCISCSKPLKGRTDKKYCNDYCRNSFHNLQHSADNNYMRQINGILHKNRRILAKLLPENATHTKIAHATLLERGFLFQYCTHRVFNKKGSQYHFCYEYGYQALDDRSCLVVKRKKQESSG